MAALSSPSPLSCLFVVLQVLPKGAQRKPPMAVISGRWVFKNPSGSFGPERSACFGVTPSLEFWWGCHLVPSSSILLLFRLLPVTLIDLRWWRIVVDCPPAWLMCAFWECRKQKTNILPGWSGFLWQDLGFITTLFWAVEPNKLLLLFPPVYVMSHCMTVVVFGGNFFVFWGVFLFKKQVTQQIGCWQFAN